METSTQIVLTSGMTDNELIGYCETHCRTERALFHADQINRMIVLAGMSNTLPGIPENAFRSMHETMVDLCELARERQKKQKVKRAIKVNGTDIELIITKHISIDVDRPLMFLEELEDKTWRLTYSKALFPDFAQIKEFQFLRREGSGRMRAPALEYIKILDHDDKILNGWEMSKVACIPDNGSARFITFQATPRSGNGLNSLWTMHYFDSLIPNMKECTGLTVIREN